MILSFPAQMRYFFRPSTMRNIYLPTSRPMLGIVMNVKWYRSIQHYCYLCYRQRRVRLGCTFFQTTITGRREGWMMRDTWTGGYGHSILCVLASVVVPSMRPKIGWRCSPDGKLVAGLPPSVLVVAGCLVHHRCHLVVVDVVVA